MSNRQQDLLTLFTRKLTKQPTVANIVKRSTTINLTPDCISSWADMLHSVMQQNRQLTLPNGDRMFMEGNLQLVFETDSLSGVSPAIILPSGTSNSNFYNVTTIIRLIELLGRVRMRSRVHCLNLQYFRQKSRHA